MFKECNCLKSIPIITKMNAPNIISNNDMNNKSNILTSFSDTQNSNDPILKDIFKENNIFQSLPDAQISNAFGLVNTLVNEQNSRENEENIKDNNIQSSFENTNLKYQIDSNSDLSFNFKNNLD